MSTSKKRSTLNRRLGFVARAASELMVLAGGGSVALSPSLITVNLEMDSNQAKAYLSNEFSIEIRRITSSDVASSNQSWISKENNVSLALRQDEARAIGIALHSGNPPDVKLSPVGLLVYENPELISGYKKGKELGQIGQIAVGRSKVGYLAVDLDAVIKAVDKQENPDRFVKMFKDAASATVRIKTERAEKLRQALPKIIADADTRSRKVSPSMDFSPDR